MLRPVFGLQHLANFSLFQDFDYCFLLFAVRYSLNSLTKRNHFGHIGGADPNVLFSLRKTAPVFTGASDERQACLIKGSVFTLRGLIIGDLSLWTGVYSGNQYSFLKMPLMKMRRFCSNTISGFIKSKSVASSSSTWNWCFHYHTHSPCLFPSTWTGIWSGHSQVSPSGEFLIMLLFMSVIVKKFLHYFPS